MSSTRIYDRILDDTVSILGKIEFWERIDASLVHLLILGQFDFDSEQKE